MLKSSKRFILSNSGLNAQGFRMLTEGAELDEFIKNPVLLYNHQRPEGNDKNQILPLGYWTEIEVNGDEISAIPVFDDKDDFAVTIYNKVEAGVLRMCSAGAEPLETSESPDLLVPGQERATVTRWRMKEGSICDIGANPGALAVALYNSSDNILTLSAQTIEKIIPTIKSMSKPKTQVPPVKKTIKLADDDKPKDDLTDPENEELTDDDPDEELADDEDKDAIIARLTDQVAQLTEQLKLATDQVALADEAKEDAKIENLVNKAISLRKITLAQKGHYIKLAKQDYGTTFDLLKSIKAAPSLKSQMGTQELSTDATRLTELSAKSFDELFKSGDLEFVKLNAPDTYKNIYTKKFGKAPTK